MKGRKAGLEDITNSISPLEKPSKNEIQQSNNYKKRYLRQTKRRIDNQFGVVSDLKLRNILYWYNFGSAVRNLEI